MKQTVQNALQAYATSLGVTIPEVIDLYKLHASTREAIGLLVLAQANPKKLAKLAKQLP